MSTESCENTNCCTPATAVAPAEAKWTKPHYRAEKDGNAYKVRVFLPGVAKSGVSVSLDKDTLTIEGVRSDTVEESWTPVFEEIKRDGYRLQLHLEVDIEEEKIEATVDDGVLNLTLPIAEAAKPKVIAVT
jgi:HSP20 family protein